MGYSGVHLCAKIIIVWHNFAKLLYQYELRRVQFLMPRSLEASLFLDKLAASCIFTSDNWAFFSLVDAFSVRRR